jgi:hypothetical protein
MPGNDRRVQGANRWVVTYGCQRCHPKVAADQVVASLGERGVAGTGLGEGEIGSGRLEVAAQKGGAVPIASGVDADAEADGVDRQWNRYRTHDAELRKENLEKGS